MMLALLRRRFAAAILSLAAATGAATSAHAADAFVPGTAATTEGGSTQLQVIGPVARTLHVGIDSALLTGLGPTITGLAFRLDGGASSAFPSSNRSVSDYEIRIGTAAVAIGSMTGTFANNISNATLVQDGAYTLTTGTLPGNSTTPSAFATVFTFATPYNYTSGTSLVIEFRSTGFGASNGIAVDGIAAGAADSSYRAFVGASFGATTGSAIAFPVMTLISPTAIPEPSTYAALAGAATLGLALLRRRRSQR